MLVARVHKEVGRSLLCSGPEKCDVIAIFICVDFVTVEALESTKYRVYLETRH
ncbi:hypothetical protein BOCO_1189 [Bombiscardovia coagulans]|uniref:Uncharacterized protein n=1 Tax=Bombiscardovia coagulans TaxID=686666 RepID=A0A261EQ29_9BIFI|nr:hypothetical protein BOCO_1189 [Bombiscardovia coagulans]